MSRLTVVLAAPIAAASCAVILPTDRVEFHYIDLRPMGLEVLEIGRPDLPRYEGDEIPLSYLAELDGEQVCVRIIHDEPSLSVQLEITAVNPNGLTFEVDPPQPEGCGASSGMREMQTMVLASWSTMGEATDSCYGGDAPDPSLTLRFSGSETDLVLRGKIKKAGEYSDYRYASL